jgi:hypothetical protein
MGTPVRPVEFRLFMAIPVATLFPALLIALAALFAKSRPYGTSRMVVHLEDYDSHVTYIYLRYVKASRYHRIRS